MGILSLMNGVLFKVSQYALRLRIMADDRSSVYNLEAAIIEIGLGIIIYVSVLSNTYVNRQ